MAGKTDTDMLPEDSSDGAAFDSSELRVDFSSEEASSEAREFTPVPAGKYPCTITDWELKLSKSEKNKGKPFWALRLRVNEGHPHQGKYFFPNVMLFAGALYSLTQLADSLADYDGEWAECATAIHKDGQGVKIPHGDTLVGKEVLAVVSKKVDQYKIDQGEWDSTSGDPKPMKNDVSGFKDIKNDKGAGASQGSGSLLPG